MKTSLTVVLPAFNAEAVLPRTVEELLEIVPELTPDFELIVVDDGSTDATREVADDLMLCYPQLRLLVQGSRLGPQEALRSALRYARGELVLLVNLAADVELHEIRKLWQRRSTEGAVFGQCEAAASDERAVPLLRGSSQDAAIADFLMVPRRVLNAWRQAGEQQSIGNFLRARGFNVARVEVRSPVRATRIAVHASASEGSASRPKGLGRKRSSEVVERFSNRSKRTPR